MVLTFRPQNIIIRMPNWLGDCVMATPVIKDIRNAFKDARITALCQTPLCSLLQYDPNLDEVFCFHKNERSFFRREEKSNVIEKIKEGEYDLGILLTNSFRSAYWFWAGNVERRLGYSSFFRRLLLNLPLPFPKNKNEQHQVVTYKHLLTKLEIPLSQTLPYLVLQEKESLHAKELLRQRGYQKTKKLIGIHPGAAYGSAKCWLPERFSEVAKRLIEKEDAFVLFFGDDQTAPLVKSICQELPLRAINMAGMTSLRELAALIHECDLLLSNDSGPMHMAAALNVPVVALFGSTSEIKTGPYGTNGCVINKKAPCSPCLRRVCPVDFRCMKEIQVEEVLEKISEQLKRGKRGF